MVWYEFWHIHLFCEGERGPEGSRGRPGENGLKGAKVRRSRCGWIFDEQWLRGFPRTWHAFIRHSTLEPCLHHKNTYFPDENIRNYTVIWNDYLETGKSTSVKLILHVPVWAGVKVESSKKGCLLFSLSDRGTWDYRDRGVSQEN